MDVLQGVDQEPLCPFISTPYSCRSGFKDLVLKCSIHHNFQISSAEDGWVFLYKSSKRFSDLDELLKDLRLVLIFMN